MACERLYVRAGSTVRAVLWLCALCSRATAAKEGLLLFIARNVISAAARRFCSAKTLVRGARDLLKLSHTSSALLRSVRRSYSGRLDRKGKIIVLQSFL